MFNLYRNYLKIQAGHRAQESRSAAVVWEAHDWGGLFHVGLKVGYNLAQLLGYLKVKD